MQPEPELILYDGVCVLCNRMMQFVLRHDPAGRFHYAALQGPVAQAILRRHHLPTASFTTLYLVVHYGTPSERLLRKARAALHVLDLLGWPWRLARVLTLLPTPVLDLGYDVVARTRYRVFGRTETCMLPNPRYRGRFLDDGVGQGPFSGMPAA
ncbi:MAG TPA: DCC1-like thiol-disulfide oxidoreductase family protein [Chloroflexia bacterium]|nr:DCC1-like thiol-disulfide oxidoreductase family protein [Chloroflexia bacterium]